MYASFVFKCWFYSSVSSSRITSRTLKLLTCVPVMFGVLTKLQCWLCDCDVEDVEDDDDDEVSLTLLLPPLLLPCDVFDVFRRTGTSVVRFKR